MAAKLCRLSVGLLATAAIVVATAGPAAACTLLLTPFTVNGTEARSIESPITVRPGDRLHIRGSDFYEIVPEAERPSTTTTTTLQGAGPIPQCAPTRPAGEVTVQLLQDGREPVELARVDGNAIDHDVVIPATAVTGPALLAVSSGGSVPLVVVPRTTDPTTPEDLPRTGAGVTTMAFGGGLLVAGGLALILAARRSVAST